MIRVGVLTPVDGARAWNARAFDTLTPALSLEGEGAKQPDCGQLATGESPGRPGSDRSLTQLFTVQPFAGFR